MSDIFGKSPKLVRLVLPVPKCFAGKHGKSFVTASFLTANLVVYKLKCIRIPISSCQETPCTGAFLVLPAGCFVHPPCFCRVSQTKEASTEGKSTGVFGDPSKMASNLGPSTTKLPTTFSPLPKDPRDWYIYLHEWLIFMVNPGIQYMDPMGLKLIIKKILFLGWGVVRRSLKLWDANFWGVGRGIVCRDRGKTFCMDDRWNGLLLGFPKLDICKNMKNEVTTCFSVRYTFTILLDSIWRGSLPLRRTFVFKVHYDDWRTSDPLERDRRFKIYKTKDLLGFPSYLVIGECIVLRWTALKQQM